MSSRPRVGRPPGTLWCPGRAAPRSGRTCPGWLAAAWLAHFAPGPPCAAAQRRPRPRGSTAGLQSDTRRLRLPAPFACPEAVLRACRMAVLSAGAVQAVGRHAEGIQFLQASFQHHSVHRHGKWTTCPAKHCPGYWWSAYSVPNILPQSTDLMVSQSPHQTSTPLQQSSTSNEASSCPIVSEHLAQCAVPKILHACSMHACSLD